MICPKCGYDSSGNYCSNCGWSLKPELKEGSEDSWFTDYDSPDEIISGRAGLPYKEPSDYAGRSRENITAISGQNHIGSQQGEKPKSRKAREKTSKSKASRTGAGSRSTATRAEKRVQKQKEARIKQLEKEVGQQKIRLESEIQNYDNSRGKRTEPYRDTVTESDGISLGEAAAKGVAQIAVLTSRIMQIFCVLLMAGMVFVMGNSFWDHGQALGDIWYLVEEKNYGLGFYVGFSGAALFMGVIWCFWTFSKKGAGGSVRMKKYDVGRGLLPFLLCGAVSLAAGYFLPRIPVGTDAWKGLGTGVSAALKAVDAQKEILIFSSSAGAVLSLVRKLLRV